MDQIAEICRTVRDVKEQTNALLRRSDGREKPTGLDGAQKVARHLLLALHRERGEPVEDTYRRLFGTQWTVRSATNPATTTTPTWAAELVGSSTVFDLLAAAPQPSLVTRLRDLGLALSGANGVYRLPFDVPSADPKAQFVGQGEAIPVIRATLSSVSVTMSKIASISTLSAELRKRAVSDAAAIIEAIISSDAQRASDRALADDQPASDKRPAGLLNGITPTTSTGDFLGDVKGVLAAVIAKGGQQPVLMMNTIDQIDLASALYGGKAGLTVLPSNEVPANRLIATDAASFVAVAIGIETDVSEQATIHESDTPAALVPPSGSIASPIRSAWQTNTLGVRVLLDLGWASAGRTAFTDYAPTP